MFAARAPFAAASGVLLSLAVFFTLWQLVSVPMATKPSIIVDKIVFTPQRRDTPVEPKQRDKPEREPPRLEPEGPPTPGTVRDPTSATPFRPEPIPILGPQRQGVAMGVDRDVLPLVRIEPEYPPRAEERGIEGWVRVRFTVTETGSVRDAVVVGSEPRATFDESALKAIARWRYNPRVEGGVAVERVGLEALIRFDLEDSSGSMR